MKLLISEFWIIHSAICIYHKILTNEKDSLSLDKQLFGGFFSALVDFSKSQFHGVDYLKDINFMNSSFAIVEIEKTLVIYRLFGQMNEKRFKQFVQPISVELSNIIKTRSVFVHLRNKNPPDPPVSISLQDYEKIFNIELKEVLLEFQLNQHQLQIIDTLSLVQLKEEFQNLLVKLGDRNSIFFVYNKLKECSEFTRNIVSTKEFPLVKGDFININLIQTELIQMLEDFFRYATTNVNNLVFASEKDILQFIKQNYLILKQFLLDEIFFKEFLRTLPQLKMNLSHFNTQNL